MNEHDFENIVAEALSEYAKNNDLPLKAVTVKDKGFGKEAGLIVTVGDVEFHLAITQTVFEGEGNESEYPNGV
jgi:hypothetical protein